MEPGESKPHPGEPKPHHRHLLKINRAVLHKTAQKIIRRAWPLLLLAYAATVYLNLRGEGEFDPLRDVLLALWVPLALGLLGNGAVYLVLLSGTKRRMRQAAQKPGPGKPARGPRREL